MKISIQYLSGLVLFTGVSVGLFITPNVSFEPLDQNKMLLLVTLSCGIFGALIANYKAVWRKIDKLYFSVISLFILQISLVLIFSNAPLNQQWFGTFGRNTGYLTYLALAILSVASFISALSANLSKYLYALFGLDVISLVYDLLQTFNHDPIKWNNNYNHIIGFLGNPDFESAFLGICGVAVVSYFLSQGQKIVNRSLALIYLLATVYLIHRSGAQQGLLVFGAGSAIVLYIYLKVNFQHKQWLSNGFLFVTLTIGFLVLGGIFQKGPLSSILYKTSVRQRGFYWHAAIKMMNQHPIFGVGLDSYGDWYLKVRSANAAFHTPITQSNAAHNVFLDFGANGGYPLLILNLTLTAYTIFCSWKLIRMSKQFDWKFTSIFGAWIAFELQSIVSINQIGLAVWGWILGGLILGYCFKSKLQSEIEVSPRRTSRNVISLKNKNNSLMGILLGICVGLALAAPYFVADKATRDAFNSRNVSKIISAVSKSPTDDGRVLQAASALAGSKLIPQAKEMVLKVIKNNPRNYNAWDLLRQISTPGSKDYKLAVGKLNYLNPQIPIK